MSWTSMFAGIVGDMRGFGPRRRQEDNVRSDIRLLVSFIGTYCRDKHVDSPKNTVTLKGCELHQSCDRSPVLCADCAKLLQHAVVKRSTCPMNPKPTCRRCERHCYAPRYRSKIRKVMGYSGRRAVLRGRIDYLLHML